LFRHFFEGSVNKYSMEANNTENKCASTEDRRIRELMVVATLNTFEIVKEINKIGSGYLSKMTKAIDRRSLGAWRRRPSLASAGRYTHTPNCRVM
jgi:hypothetical protein